MQLTLEALKAGVVATTLNSSHLNRYLPWPAVRKITNQAYVETLAAYGSLHM